MNSSVYLVKPKEVEQPKLKKASNVSKSEPKTTKKMQNV